MGEIQAIAAQGWVDLFQQLFAAHTDSWMGTLGTWDDLFRAEGRSNSELIHAVLAISRRTSEMPQFPTQFLQALREELRKIDASMAGAESAARAASTKPTRCMDCRDSGLYAAVPTPNLSCVFGMEWRYPYYTVAVCCHCGLGRWKFDNWKGRQDKARPYSFDEYVQANPDWKAQVELRAKAKAAEAAAAKLDASRGAWSAALRETLANGGVGKPRGGVG